MTREEEIKEAAQKYIYNKRYYESNIRPRIFEAGATWADRHPVNPWHSVADGDLPEKTGNYLCSDGEESIVAFYSHVSEGFFNPLEKYGGDYDDLIKYWMEIPQLPNIRKIIK